MADTPVTPFRLEPEILALLDALAVKLKTTRAGVVRKAVRELATRHKLSVT